MFLTSVGSDIHQRTEKARNQEKLNLQDLLVEVTPYARG